MGMFDDPMLLALASGANSAGQLAMPTRTPTSNASAFGQIIGNAINGGMQGQMSQQDLLAKQLQNFGAGNQLTGQQYIQKMMGLPTYGNIPGTQNAPGAPQQTPQGASYSPFSSNQGNSGGLSPLTAAQIKFESSGNPNAVSPKGAHGLMQLMPSTAANPGFGITPAQDNSPQENVRVGQEYQQALIKKYGDTGLGLMAYNWGTDNVDKWLSAGADPNKVPKETQDYVNNVIGALPSGVTQTTAPQTNTPPQQTPMPQQQQAQGNPNAPLVDPRAAFMMGRVGAAYGVPGSEAFAKMAPVPEGFYMTQQGTLAAMPGGPKDLSRISQESAATEAGKAAFEPVQVQVPDGKGGFTNVQTTKANVPALTGNGAVIPTKETFEGDNTYFNKTIQPAYEAAQQSKEQLATMSNSLNNLAANATLHPGEMSKYRIQYAKTINDIANTLDPNGEHLRDNDLASSDAMQKAGTRLGFALSKTLGSREAAQVVQQAIGSNPNQTLSTQSNKLLISLLNNSADRMIGRYQAGYGAIRSGGLSQDAIQSYDKAHPEQEFVDKAYVQSGTPIKGKFEPPPAPALQLLQQHSSDPKVIQQFNQKYGPGLSFPLANAYLGQ